MRLRRAAHVMLTRNTSGLARSEEHTSELQSHLNIVCRLLLEKKKQNSNGAENEIIIIQAKSLQPVDELINTVIDTVISNIRCDQISRSYTTDGSVRHRDCNT